MKDFLKKYLSEEQLKEVEEKYLAEHVDAKGLPVYISKSRLDEVLGQKKSAEEALNNAKLEMEALQKNSATQLEQAIKQEQEKASKDKEDALNALKADFGATEAIYKAKGRNVTAIKSLIDNTKKIDDEIARIQKSDPYLFDDDIPSGTGKKDATDKDSTNQKELDRMRAAVGI